VPRVEALKEALPERSFDHVSRADGTTSVSDASRTPWPRLLRRRPATVAGALSVLVHAVVLAVVTIPRPSPADFPQGPERLRLLDLPPRVDVPPPPGEIEAPPPPRAAVVEAGSPSVGSGPAVSPAPPEPGLEPPPVEGTAKLTSTIAKVEVAPMVERPEIFRRRLARYSGDVLRRPGAGGVVELHLYVDPRGRVSEVDVAESSGHARLDRAARDVAREIEFLPALNRDRTVGVWVSQRICFLRLERPEPGLSPAECERRARGEGG